ncbi:hypothetical protein JB92DRAFT_2835174 [Gautieria morchelliformis]|nr:hypothetical protein JB92DRAFT_2835174 [Gautieria morchelliformis]
MSSASSSPIWPNSPQQTRRAVPPGFFVSKKPHAKPLEQLSRRELLDLWNQNKKILDEPYEELWRSFILPETPSTSTYHQRILREQSVIETILGMASLEDGLNRTHISQDESMDISMSSSPPSRTVDAKRRAIGRYHANTQQRGTTAALGLDEAMALEQQAHVAALQRQQHEMEKRLQRGLPLPGEILTREEREARIWAFMNAKPSESDEEDEDWDDDDEDPSTWFEDEEDDGRKGQPLVDPDEIAGIIRVDDSRWADQD